MNTRNRAWFSGLILIISGFFPLFFTPHPYPGLRGTVVDWCVRLHVQAGVFFVCKLVFYIYKGPRDSVQICSPKEVGVQHEGILELWPLTFVQLPFFWVNLPHADFLCTLIFYNYKEDTICDSLQICSHAMWRNFESLTFDICAAFFFLCQLQWITFFYLSFCRGGGFHK